MRTLMHRAGLVLGLGLLAIATPAIHAAPVTQCSSNAVCFCYNDDFKLAIDAQVDKLRAMIAAERAKGRSIGYLSIPLSTAGGGYFNLNREVAERIKQRVESRFGASAVWLLNPAMKEADIPPFGNARAGGAEFMVMWMRVLEGASGLGEDFDFVYFSGPGDFGAALGLTGTGDLERLGTLYSERLASDPDFKRAVDQGRITPQGFRNYYGLRASVNFSLGAHDEWNIVGKINNRRRSDPKWGVVNQLPSLYDGRSVSSAEADSLVTGGYSGQCKLP